MTEQSLLALADLHDSPTHMQAIAELIAEEIAARAELLRNSVRENRIPAAYGAEGAITALEELTSGIERRVAEYRAGQIRI